MKMIFTIAGKELRSLFASPMAWVEAAQAVRQLNAGPRAPVSSARCESGMFGSCSSSRMAFILAAATVAQIFVSIWLSFASNWSFCVKSVNSLRLMRAWPAANRSVPSGSSRSRCRRGDLSVPTV